jgi:hypothetical protein
MKIEELVELQLSFVYCLHCLYLYYIFCLFYNVRMAGPTGIIYID